MPSMVVMRRPVTAESGVWQLRVGLPSTCTVQAPRSPMPQPTLVPIMSRKSRSTQRRGVSGSASTETGLPLTLSGVMRVSPLGFLGFGELERRVVAAVLRSGDELARLIGPELAHFGVGGDGGVHQLAAFALHLADVDVEDRLGVLAEADRSHRAVLELDIVQRFDERRVVLDPAFHRLERLLQPQARGIRARGIEPRRHLVLALDRGDEALVVGGVAIDRVPARRVHAERLIAHVLEDALADECGIAEQRQLQAVLLVGAQKAQRIGAGEARIDAIDVALQLPGERAVVGYVERRPGLLHHGPAAVLAPAMNAR